MKYRIGWITVSGLALVLAAIGCERFTGGGWIVSPGDATKKATFGLELNCVEGDFDSEADAPDARLSGHLTFHDHGTLVPDTKGRPKQLAFQASVEDLLSELSLDTIPDTSCDDLDELFAGAFGFDGYAALYTPQPASLGDPGFAVIGIEDNGKQGPDKGDVISVYLLGGAFDGYTATGELQGGQITLHQ